MAYSIFLYDWFYIDGTDLFPNEHMTKHQAEQKLFEEFPDSKIELMEEVSYDIEPAKGAVAYIKKVNREEYYVIYPNNFVEGAFIKIEKKRPR